MPHTVFRPTNLVGDSVTGWTSQGQIVQLMSDWICRGRAPLLPAHAASGWTSSPGPAVQGGAAGGRTRRREREFWVTYGAEAMDMEASLQVLAKHAANLGRELAIPPLVDPDALTDEDLARMRPMVRNYVSVLRDVSEVTRCSGASCPPPCPSCVSVTGSRAWTTRRRTCAAWSTPRRT
ncbi:hypothetical protein NKH77_53815 [Streptomyces sp. M19]